MAESSKLYMMSYVVSASMDNTLRVWDIESAQEFAKFTAEAPLLDCSVGSDGRTIITGDDQGWVHLLRLEGLEI